MKKRIFLLIILLFIPTGFSARHEIVLNDTITETIILELPSNAYDLAEENRDEEFSNSPYNYLIDQSYSFINSAKYTYKKHVKEKKDKIIVQLGYEFDYDNYLYSKQIHDCFHDVVVVDDEEYFYISLKEYNNCYYEENEQTEYIIETKYKVINQNADKVRKNQYIWHLDSENKKDIEFQILKEEVKTSPIKTIKIVGFSIIAILSIITLIIYIKHKKIS